MVNRGEEKVRVHMNVVPRSTGNTNNGTENRPRSIYQYSNMGPRLSGLTSIFGVVFFVSKSPVGIERQKKLAKNLLTSVGIEPTTSRLDLPSLCRLSYKVAQRKSGTILESKIFSLPRVVPCFPLLGLTPSGLFMGLSST